MPLSLDMGVANPFKSDNVIGFDFGRRSLAVTSTGNEWDGKPIQKVRDNICQN